MDQITDKVWLGNASASRNIALLKKNGISKVLTVMNNPPHTYKESDGISLNILIYMISLEKT